MIDRSGWIPLTMLALLAVVVPGSSATDPALYDQLDIVPMPKDIALTGRELPMAAP